MIYVLASNNAGKLAEMKTILNELNIEVVSQREMGCTVSPDENGSTFVENAFLKAECICSELGQPTIADDSGLCVEALGGAPGIYSARYGGSGLDDTDRYMLLLKNMDKLENRKAKFECAIACVMPNGDRIQACSECHGEILTAPSGDGGFGYDPVFYIPELGKTMAELTPEEKNQISHRGKALRKFREKLIKYYQTR